MCTYSVHRTVLPKCTDRYVNVCVLQTAGLLSIYPVVMLTVVWRYKYTAVLLSVQTVLKCKCNVKNINVELQIVYL